MRPCSISNGGKAKSREKSTATGSTRRRTGEFPVPSRPGTPSRESTKVSKSYAVWPRRRFAGFAPGVDRTT